MTDNGEEHKRQAYQHHFGFLLKTHCGDFAETVRLVASFDKHNTDCLPLFIVVPPSEMDVFAQMSGENVKIINEDDILGKQRVLEGAHGMTSGYLNQQLVKLLFCHSGYCRHYLCLDADAIFIRSFKKHDFLDSSGEPINFVTFDGGLTVDPRYYNRHQRRREQFISTIKNTLNYKKEIPFAAHGLVTLSSQTVVDLQNYLWLCHSTSFAQMIMMAPLEFSWYLVWNLKNATMGTIREARIKTFHTFREFLWHRINGVGITDLQRSYIGIVINGNYAKKYGVTGYSTSLLHTVIPFFKHAAKSALNRALRSC